MQIFEINKKIQTFWFFLALPSFPREKALRKATVVKETTIFINNGNAKTNMPLQKTSLSLWAERKDGYFEKQRPMKQDTLLGIMHDQWENRARATFHTKAEEPGGNEHLEVL